jgi:kynurenine formamidase
METVMFAKSLMLCCGSMLAVSVALDAAPLDLEGAVLVDLTYPFNEETVYWPTAPRDFELERLAYGPTEAGYFYAANALCTPEHGGTHLDAPIHFHENRRTVEDVPLSQLIGPAVVIDVQAKAAADRDYRLKADDVLDFERRHGRIEADSIVLLRTGWGKFWPDRKAYLGDDTPGDASRLSFPSYGADAARLLVEERQVAVLGVDTASIDYGRSTDFVVHRIAAAANVAGLENVANLEQLPPRGTTIIALPMKVEGGSGAPVRVVALVERTLELN